MDNRQQAVRMYDYEGYMLQDFSSAREAARFLDIKEESISQVISGRSFHAGAFQFRKLKRGTPVKLPSLYEHFNAGKGRIPCAKYWNGRLICVYNSLSEAAERNNISQANITQSMLRGGTYKGFTWKEIK
jgi:hypothetical protein